MDPNHRLKSKEIYYMGYHSSNTPPNQDNYYSSSGPVKELIKKLGKKSFKKKILGIFVKKEIALEEEVLYHKKFIVSTHPRFLYKALQTTTGFEFDNTGRVNSIESNIKRSITQLGKAKQSPESRASIAYYQKYERVRTEEELERLKTSAQERNKQLVTCPHCGKEGQFTAFRRWHFENCKHAPNPSQKSIEQREQLKQNAVKRNLENNPRKTQ